MVVVFGSHNCDLRGLVPPSRHPAEYFGTLGHFGRPWEQQEGRVEVQIRIFSNFVMILGLQFESSSNTEFYKSGVVFAFVSMPLLTPISESKSGHIGFFKQGFRMEGIPKIMFSQEMISGDI